MKQAGENPPACSTRKRLTLLLGVHNYTDGFVDVKDF
jgi:hypothetical protein